MVDAGTGNVIDGGHIHDRLPPASLTKVLTALTVARLVAPDDVVTISPRAAAAPPSSLGVRPGQRWPVSELVRGALLVSGNDAAYALAERAGGSVEGFGAQLTRTASLLGMGDRPQLRDPAGLDDAKAVGGGNLISARDLAIAAQAVLAVPGLTPIVGSRTAMVSAVGVSPRHLVNHNKLLFRYRGAIGVKTGYTQRAGGCLIMAARRGRRTMISVVLGSADIYGSSRYLLDEAFATPAGAERRTADRLAPFAPSSIRAVQPLHRRVLRPVDRSSPFTSGIPLGLLLAGTVVLARYRFAKRRRRKRSKAKAKAKAAG